MYLDLLTVVCLRSNYLDWPGIRGHGESSGADRLVTALRIEPVTQASAHLKSLRLQRKVAHLSRIGFRSILSSTLFSSWRSSFARKKSQWVMPGTRDQNHGACRKQQQQTHKHDA